MAAVKLSVVCCIFPRRTPVRSRQQVVVVLRQIVEVEFLAEGRPLLATDRHVARVSACGRPKA